MLAVLSFLFLFACANCQEQNSPFLDGFRDLFDNSLDRHIPMRTTPKKVDNNCVCGQFNIARQDDEKVINGVEVNPKYKYPWMVALKINGQVSCGGSLINDKFILTAARCVENKQLSIYEAVMGVHNVAKVGNSNPTDLTGEPYGQTSKISHIKVFPRYYGGPWIKNDIALLKLATPVKFTKQVSPVCLPVHQNVYSQAPMDSVIMGWGITETLSPSDVLKEAVVKVFNADQCRKESPAYSYEITDEMVCARSPGKDTCQGDSGGPLVVKGTSFYTQLGIASFVQFESCLIGQYPGIYTSVPSFVNYIYALTKGGTYCKNPNLGQ